MDALLSPAVALAVLAAGIFLVTGLLTGIWKYQAIMQSDKARAPYYVDIAHRSALLYASSALILAALAYFSVWSDAVNFYAVLANVIYFALAIGSYVLHGLLKDTDNQFRQPHKIAKWTLPSILMRLFMWSLILAELGGTLVLLAGAWKYLWPLTMAAF
ncbi:hypothetical protein ACF3NA_02375 [Alkanindiges sp. WGS2144]|uniref:hypothetical protein n=1 Tax=Alkanindiges sp. WGS2144 TaxID=3366808 RepID=UPI0037525F82